MSPKIPTIVLESSKERWQYMDILQWIYLKKNLYLCIFILAYLFENNSLKGLIGDRFERGKKEYICIYTRFAYNNLKQEFRAIDRG